MQAGKIQSLYIILLTVLYTAEACFGAMLKHLCGNLNRQWVDNTLQRWTQRMIKLFQIHYRVVNPHHTEPQPGKPTIVMCNHSSLFDIPLSLLAFPKHSLRMLAKKELYRIPIMSQGMRLAEFPCIDRKNRHQAIKDLQVVERLLASGIVMWIAPEGTRSKNGKLASFKKGGFITAIQTGATIIPIGIRGAYGIIPSRTYQLNINLPAEIHIGEPVDASKFSLENKEALIDLVHQKMLQLVGEKP